MDRKELIKNIHFKSSKLSVCLKCDHVFIGLECPFCGSRYTRPSTAEDHKALKVRLTGKESCRDMSEEELEKVDKAFYEMGWKDVVRKVKKEVYQSRKKARWFILQEASRIFRSYPKERVEGFCRNVLKKEFEKLDDKELRNVLGWLHRTEKSLERKAAQSGKIEENKE